MFYVPDSFIEKLIGEDLQFMDLTVDAMGIEDVPGLTECFPKQDCVLAGVEVAAQIFEKAGVKAEILLASGYPDAQEHVARHHELLQKCSGLLDQDAESPVTSVQMLQCIIHDLVLNHMVKEDGKYFAYLKTENAPAR